MTQCIVRYDPNTYDIEQIRYFYKAISEFFSDMEVVCIPNDLEISFLNQDSVFKIENIVKL